MKIKYCKYKSQNPKIIKYQTLVMKAYFITILLLVGFLSYSQTGIGTVAPHASAQLEILSDNKGVLFPRVTLKGDEDKTSISGGDPAMALVVYNTGLYPDFPTKGFMFWNGTKWRLLIDANTTKAQISVGLIDNTAVLNPNSYTAGVNYKGVLEVSYNGGNGGYYSEGDAYFSNGLSFKLQPGQATGVGKLSYIVTGKPTVSSPSSINNVPIYFLSNNLGNLNIGGASVTQATQYSLYRSIPISVGETSRGTTGVNNGYSGTKLVFRKNNDVPIESVVLPETGSYVFSFRLYGSTAGSPKVAPFYISALKQMGSSPTDRPTDLLLDIFEITLIKYTDYSNYTYSANLSVSGNAGDRIYFKMSGANGFDLIWTLLNGTNDLNYGNMANKTSMFYWKL